MTADMERLVRLAIRESFSFSDFGRMYDTFVRFEGRGEVGISDGTLLPRRANAQEKLGGSWARLHRPRIHSDFNSDFRTN